MDFIYVTDQRRRKKQKYPDSSNFGLKTEPENKMTKQENKEGCGITEPENKMTKVGKTIFFAVIPSDVMV